MEGSPLPGSASRSTQEGVSGEDTQNPGKPHLSHLLREDLNELLAGFSVHFTPLSPPTLTRSLLPFLLPSSPCACDVCICA